MTTVFQDDAVNLGICFLGKEQRPPLAGVAFRQVPCVELGDPRRHGIVVIAARRESIGGVPVDLLVRAAEGQDRAAVLS